MKDLSLFQLFGGGNPVIGQVVEVGEDFYVLDTPAIVASASDQGVSAGQPFLVPYLPTSWSEGMLHYKMRLSLTGVSAVLEVPKDSMLGKLYKEYIGATEETTN